MRTIKPLLALFLLAATAAACKKAGEGPKADLEVTTVPGSSMGTTPAAQNPPAAPMASGHATGMAPGAPPTSAVTGSILETMDSGGYTYMKLKLEGGGETWAAVNQAKVKKGQTVALVNAVPMDGFSSKTLNRTFAHILFGQLDSRAASTPAGAMPAAVPAAGPGEPASEVRAQMAAQHAGLSRAPDPGKVDVPKAEGAGAKRVAEVFAQKAQLDGKSVTIRGKVVKFTPGVMGRNWIHLRDGSGSAEARDNDITVTSKDATAVGETVVVKGKVGVGRDFGMGYSYPVLVEDATVTK